MPVTINGAPTHVLIVHLVVVLLPLSVIAALVLVFVPRSRKAFSLTSLVIAAIACLAIPLAFLSGGKLRGRVAPSPLIDDHVNAAHELIVVAAVFGVVFAAFVALDVWSRAAKGELNQVEAALLSRVPAPTKSSRRRRMREVVSALLVLLALITGALVYRVGDTGARAAWHDRLNARG